VIAAGFLALHYLEPNPTQDINKVNALTKQMLGYELLGYQVFLGSEVDAPELITNHVCRLSLNVLNKTLMVSFLQWDSLKSIIYPHDPKLWATDMAPLGAIRAWLTSDRIAPLPSYLSQEVCTCDIHQY
jgi:soluble epoxide hydrolase / lipid-phosphate phosphatase